MRKIKSLGDAMELIREEGSAEDLEIACQCLMAGNRAMAKHLREEMPRAYRGLPARSTAAPVDLVSKYGDIH